MRSLVALLFFLLFPQHIFSPAWAVEDSPTGAFGSRQEQGDREKSYISPFLERDRLNILTIGDWMAHGVWWGLYDRFSKDRMVSFTRNSSYASGFVRREVLDWNLRVKRLVARKRVDIAIIAIGSNDGRDMRRGAEKLSFNSQAWREIYQKRVDRLVVTLKEHGAAIYWLGLPIVKRPDKAEQFRILNGIFKQIARKNEVKFIDSWYEFTDKSGAFTFAGLNINGKPRILRTPNGLHFTMPGYRKLGKLVDRILSADLSAMDAVTKSSLEGSREKEIAIVAPDAGVPGRLSPESDSRLERGDYGVSFINDDRLTTGSIPKNKMIIDTISELPGDISTEVSPTSLRVTRVSQTKITKPVILKTQNSLASPEVDILLKGGLVPAKPGRDDDYSWPRKP